MRWHPNLIVQCLIAAEEGSQVGILGGKINVTTTTISGLAGLFPNGPPSSLGMK